MKKLRLLHMQHFIYPYRFPLFEELGRTVELDVFFCQERRPWREWNTELPREKRFSATLLRSIRIGPIVFNWGLGRILREHYDIYSVASLDYTTFFQFVRVLLVAKVRRAPFVMVDEFIDTSYYRTKRRISYAINIAIRWLLYKQIDAFVLWNTPGVDFVKKLGVPRHKIFVGPQVLAGQHNDFRPSVRELSEIQEARKQRGTKIVLYVGSLIERKGPHVLIRAFRELAAQDLRLVIVGKGEMENALKDLAKADGRISFLGHLEGREKRNVFRDADIFVLPSLHEPWGFVVNEALAWGLPVITTTAVGCSGYLVRDNGYVVEPNNEEQLRTVLRSVIGDEETMRRMAEASLRRSEEFSVEDMARPVLSAIQACSGAQL